MQSAARAPTDLDLSTEPAVAILPTGFLDLPAELRSRIYELISDHNITVPVLPWRPPPVLSVNGAKDLESQSGSTGGFTSSIDHTIRTLHQTRNAWPCASSTARFTMKHPPYSTPTYDSRHDRSPGLTGWTSGYSSPSVCLVQSLRSSNVSGSTRAFCPPLSTHAVY
ncbi:hypothetical protein AC579_975 [Pseudocercospora musae]|uniref:Uncharacterized protein n=1 Tax=Pseudocercospora musae TaxID=113226 RepID=A0A139IU63_9PEZI|nr:hypothetical protein AC579_975 [Pseudocercospora musae]